ncbi:MAG: hypothetical protein PWP16_1581 [Eubacteriaceae bacterium]|jgi:hypothetical protein|nr:hypothetical protein [Eubacteriaceae bacterium]
MVEDGKKGIYEEAEELSEKDKKIDSHTDAMYEEAEELSEKTKEEQHGFMDEEDKK